MLDDVRHVLCNERSRARFAAAPRSFLDAPAEDPVCRAAVARSGLPADDDGVRWYFHDAACRDAFLAHPARYLEPEAPPSGAARLQLQIHGMTCASCARTVKAALETLPGVQAQVNLATRQAELRSERAVPLAEVQRAVQAAGYQAAPVQAGHDLAREEVAAARRRAAAAMGLALPLIAVAMLEFAGRVWVEAGLGTLAVIVGGASLLRAAAVRARQGTASMDTLVALGARGRGCRARRWRWGAAPRTSRSAPSSSPSCCWGASWRRGREDAQARRYGHSWTVLRSRPIGSLARTHRQRRTCPRGRCASATG